MVFRKGSHESTAKVSTRQPEGPSTAKVSSRQQEAPLNNAPSAELTIAGSKEDVIKQESHR